MNSNRSSRVPVSEIAWGYERFSRAIREDNLYVVKETQRPKSNSSIRDTLMSPFSPRESPQTPATIFTNNGAEEIRNLHQELIINFEHIKAKLDHFNEVLLDLEHSHHKVLTRKFDASLVINTTCFLVPIIVFLFEHAKTSN